MTPYNLMEETSSANLKKKKKGFAKNILEMYKGNRINVIEYFCLKFFYEAKYSLLLVRQFFFNLNK